MYSTMWRMVKDAGMQRNPQGKLNHMVTEYLKLPLDTTSMARCCMVLFFLQRPQKPF